MTHLKIASRTSGQEAHRKVKTVRKPAWQAVFVTQEEYDRSVASVVARIKSGEVHPRIPDEE